MNAPLRCLCLTAPTGCGKTDIALDVARRLPVEIVSMDSAMVYRGMDIGTAKPPAHVLAEVPHHLVDIADPAESYSAGQFRRDAERAIAGIQARGKLALVVGGTMLYLRALEEGLARLPERDPAIRRALDEEAAALGWPALHARLARVDPAAARRIAPGDRQRIQRALEVHALTGQPLSRLQHESGKASETTATGGTGTGGGDAGGAPLIVTTIALVPQPREALAERLERRFDEMAAAGFVDEVRALVSRGDVPADAPSMRCVGYRQIRSYLEGAYDWPEARRRAVAATRQLAKRQLTWLRRTAPHEILPAWDPDAGRRLLEHAAAELERLRAA